MNANYCLQPPPSLSDNDDGHYRDYDVHHQYSGDEDYNEDDEDDDDAPGFQQDGGQAQQHPAQQALKGITRHTPSCGFNTMMTMITLIITLTMVTQYNDDDTLICQSSLWAPWEVYNARQSSWPPRPYAFPLVLPALSFL